MNQAQFSPSACRGDSMSIERRRPRTSRRLFGDRERIQVLEVRQLLTHLSGASVTTAQPSLATTAIASQISTVGTIGVPQQR